MTWLDGLLQRWRIREALRHVPAGARVLDVGTYDGSLLRLGGLTGVGIDPVLQAPTSLPEGIKLIAGEFPGDLRDEASASFDAVTALAVIEHVQEVELAQWSDAFARLVRPGGVLVITVPSPPVDRILHILMRLRLVAGIEAHQHHGFEPADVSRHFAGPSWSLVVHRRFQLGLNNLFVLSRT